MECMEAKALKSRELREQGMKSNQQAFLDDLWCLNGANGVPGDDFSVDCFLDFSAGELEDGGSVEEEEEEEEDKDSSSDSSHDNNSISAVQSSESLLADELSVPVDDVAGLEWVSQFVDDSVPEFRPQVFSLILLLQSQHQPPSSSTLSTQASSTERKRKKEEGDENERVDN